MKKIYSCLQALLPLAPVMAQPPDTRVHTVLFLGNSITYAGNYITDVEACYALWHSRQTIQWINLGLPSETVSGLSEPGHAGGQFARPDLHERLHRILARVKADIIIACYGMNDGIYLPFDAARFERYRQGMTWLHDTLAATGARVILLTPPVYDEQRGHAAGYAAVLDRYARWLLHQRKKAGWEIADIHYPMKQYLEAHRKQDPSFALAADGVHPGDMGHWLMARQLLLYLGEQKAAAFTGIADAAKDHLHADSILLLFSSRQVMMKNAWLQATGHTRPGMPRGLPLQEALLQAAHTGRQIDRLLLP